MQKGFTSKTLAFVGAALLSGSVFAEGPTLANMPTVIITDKNADGTFTPGGQYDNGGSGSATTENRYRFTDAIDLASGATATDLGDSTAAEVEYLFAEYNSDSAGAEGSQRTGGAHAIYVNGSAAFDGSVDRAAVLANGIGNLQDDNLLSFVDQVRSGGDASAPGPNPGGNFTDYALLKLYAASNNAATASEPVSVKSLRVITTNDDPDGIGDNVSTPTSVRLEACVDEFVGWYSNGSAQALPDVSEDLTASSTGFAGLWRSDLAPVLTPTATGVANSTSFVGVTVPVTQASDNPSALGVFVHASPGNSSDTSPDNQYAPQFAVWQSWRRDIEAAPKTTVAVSADTIYMIRWLVTVQAATQSAISPLLPDVRFRVGEATDLGIGQAHDVLSAPGANGITGAGQKEHRSYYLAPAYIGSGEEIGFMFDTFDFYQGNGGGFYTEGNGADYGLNLDKIEVYSFSRSSLSGENVEVNLGGGSFTIADGSTPPAGESAFTQFTGLGTGDWQHRGSTFVNNFAGPTDRNPTSAFAADTLTMTLVGGKENVIGIWDTLGYVFNHATPPSTTPDNTANEIVSGVANTKLLVLDTWLSSPQGSTANNHLPVLRVGFSTDIYGESGFTSASPVHQITQGRTSYIEFRGWNRTDAEDVGVVVASPLGLETGAKQYTAIMEPMVRAAGASTIDVRPFIEYWSFPLDLTAAAGTFRDDTADAGSIRTHRVVITTYDVPSYPGACTP